MNQSLLDNMKRETDPEDIFSGSRGWLHSLNLYSTTPYLYKSCIRKAAAISKRHQFGSGGPSKVLVLRSSIPTQEERKLKPARKSQPGPAGHEANL